MAKKEPRKRTTKKQDKKKNEKIKKELEIAKKEDDKLNQEKQLAKEKGTRENPIVKKEKLQKKELTADATYIKSHIKHKEKYRTLALMSRNATTKARHLLKDLDFIIPNLKLENKLSCRDNMSELFELAECHDQINMICYIQTIKKDYYMYLGNTPSGPCCKFQITNLKSILEMRTIGNALQYSRPVLSFSNNFDLLPEAQVVKKMLSNFLNVPLYHPKSQPFVDRVYHLNLNSETMKISFRHYEIKPEIVKLSSNNPEDVPVEDMSLIEIGPTFNMQLIHILGGPFKGPMLFKNENYVSPMALRKAVAIAAQYKSKDKLRKKDNRVSMMDVALRNDDEMHLGAIFSDVESDEEEEMEEEFSKEE